MAKHTPQKGLLVPNFTPKIYPQLLCYPNDGQWVYWLYPQKPILLPATSQAIGNGPAILERGKLLVLFNDKSEATAIGFCSPKFLNQNDALDKLTSISVGELGRMA